MTTLLSICHVHDLAWDIDRDPPHVCAYEDDYDHLVWNDRDRDAGLDYMGTLPLFDVSAY